MALKLQINAFETDIDRTSNSSYIEMYVDATTSGASYNLGSGAYITGSLSSTKETKNIPQTSYTIGQNTTKTIYSGKFGPFYHNDDGSLNAVNISVNARLTSNTSASATFQCPMSKITRASIPNLSTNNAKVGDTITVYTNRETGSNYTHKFSYRPPDRENYYWLWDTEANSSGITESKQLTIPINWLQYFKTTSVGIFQIRCDTYSGSTYIGQNFVNISVSARDSDKPTYTLSLEEANQNVINSGLGVYVQNNSELKINLNNITQCYSSPLDYYYVVIKDSSGNILWDSYQPISESNSNATSLSVKTSTLTRAGTYNVYAILYDKRNGSNEQGKSYTCYEYSPPQITNVSVARSTSQGVETPSGTYLKYTFVASISSVNNKNLASYYISYKPNTSSSYSIVSLSASSKAPINHVGQVLNGVTFSSNSIYDIEFMVYDSLGYTAIDRTLGADFKLVNYNSSGKSMAFGTISNRSSNEKYIDCNMTFNCMDGLELNGTDINTIIENKINKITSSAIVYRTSNLTTDSPEDWNSINVNFSAFKKYSQGNVSYYNGGFNSSSEYGIKIGSGISMVEVHGWITVLHTSNLNYDKASIEVHIFKNGVSTGIIGFGIYNRYDTLTIYTPKAPLEVTQNDVITLKVYFGGGGSLILYSTSDRPACGLYVKTLY